MAYIVRTLPRAEADAQQIYDWIKEKSPDGAYRWWLAFLDACDRLKRQAISQALAPEAEGSDREIRQILFKTPRVDAIEHFTQSLVMRFELSGSGVPGSQN